MDAITHTILACITIYLSYRVGKKMSTKGAIQQYTKHLEDQGYVKIEQMRDGSFEFIKHWNTQRQEESVK
jgi:hypothetical protein